MDEWSLRNEILHGRPDGVTASTEVHAGPFTVRLVGSEIRGVCLGTRVIIDRLYVAVRDVGWNTVLGEVHDIELSDEGNSFLLAYRSRHQSDNIDVVIEVAVRGEADGQLTFDMKAESKSDFTYNKIGLNIHHSEYSTSPGFRYRCGSVGVTQSGTFPELVAPQTCSGNTLSAFSPEFSWLELEPEALGTIRFLFEGDIFEMQDHRNWADPGFKTYSTPLSRAVPLKFPRGQVLHQAVKISWSPTPCSDLEDVSRETVGEWNSDPSPIPFARVPSIGTFLGREAGALPGPILETLQGMNFGFVEVDCETYSRDSLDHLEQLAVLASRIAPLLSVAVVVDSDWVHQLEDFDQVVRQARIDPQRIVVIDTSRRFGLVGGMPHAALAQSIRDLFDHAPKVIAGTRSYFADLNRDWTDAGAFDGVAFPINSQAHLNDDEALLANVSGQKGPVNTARVMIAAGEVHITPVAFVLPEGPFAIPVHQLRVIADSSKDRRQDTLLGAVWTFLTLRELVQEGVESVCLFDAAGSRGLITGHVSAEGLAQVTPLFHVVLDFCLWAGREVRVTSFGDLRLPAVSSRSGQQWLIANPTPQAGTVTFSTELGASAFRLRSLALNTFEAARKKPWEFREKQTEHSMANGIGRIHLTGYDYLAIEFSE